MNHDSNKRESHKHTIKQKKRGSKEYRLNDFIYVKLQKKKRGCVFPSSLTNVFAFDFWKRKNEYL